MTTAREIMTKGVDGTEVVGVVSQADLARRLSKSQVAEFLAAVSS